MRPRNVRYHLVHGFIHNWLVAGPQTIAVELEQFKGDDIRQQIAQQYYELDSGIVETPVERGPLTEGLFQVGDYTGSWSYLACGEDHLIEYSKVYSEPQYVRSWAYTQLNSKAAEEVMFVLTTHGPADVWLNGQHVHRQEHFRDQEPQSVPFRGFLNKGTNQILVRFEAVALGACVHAIALQVAGAETVARVEPHQGKRGIEVTIPSLIRSMSRRNKFEQAAVVTYITQDVFEANDRIELHWPDDLKHSSAAVVRLMTPAGKIHAEGTVDGTAGDRLFLQFPHQIPAGPYCLLIMPLAWEYYERDLRITREISLWSLGRDQFSTAPYGTYEQRRREALLRAAQGKGLFAAIAKMALDQWPEVETEVILQATRNGGPVELLGILGMLYRFGERPQFPKELLQPLKDYILNYPYQPVEYSDIGTVKSESDSILSCAVEILAGQLQREELFSHGGKDGEWHRQNGERQALEWLHQRGTTGFSDWDSNTSFATLLLALSYLVDLAESQTVWEMAAVVMDKLFVTLAINSYRGVFGSTHGRTSASSVKGGLLEPTSGIQRLMWGMGIFNHHIAEQVSLACLENYELPSIIADIATFLPEDIWSRECHAVSTTRVVNKVTYKTPDTMLCSAQDYFAGHKGRQEHIWQATLGATATVFVTHPACSSEEDARQPNFWAGNAILPRVAQWKDVLIAAYQLPEDDWMGFTHAYFPTYAFDEYVLRQDWAFARKGDGYLAITAAQGFNLLKNGPYAFRELRSYGHDNIWLCHMGRAAFDGDFSSFQEKILDLNVKFVDASVQLTSLRGETYSFGWQGPFLRDGHEQPLSGFEHYENPLVESGYPSRQMEIRFGETALRLEFGNKAAEAEVDPLPPSSEQTDVS